MDPALFAWEVFGIVLWHDPEPGFASQLSVARAIVRHDSVAWRSGHKVGKSALAAILALWFYALFPGARVVLTAPTSRQIREVIWREVRILFRLAASRGMHLGGVCNESYSAGLVGPGGRQIIGIATDEQDRFSGISGANVLYIVDEGSGVEDPIWEAIEGNRAGGAKLLTLGNPTRTAGAFFRAFHEESRLWSRHHTSSERTPNVRAGTKVIPGVAELRWVEDARIRWAPHETHALYAIRVRGNFPTRGIDAIFSLQAVEASEHHFVTVDLLTGVEEMKHPLVCGLDPARFGDDLSVLVVRRANRIVGVYSTSGLDSFQVASWALGKARSHQHVAQISPSSPFHSPIRMNVDVIGIGAGVYDFLARSEGVTAVPVNVSETSDEEDQYANLRSQLWFGAADWIAHGGMIPQSDPRLRADCLAAKYSFDLRGRQKVESKDDMKKRIGRSPDFADAFCLAVYMGGRYDAPDAKIGHFIPGL